MGKKTKQTAEVRDLDIGQTKLVPISRLAVSPHNVRKTDINDVTGLKASILEHGLLEALVGYDVTDPTDATVATETIGEATVLVAAGQRRLIALQQLAAEGLVAADAPVPVRLVDEVTAIEVSLAENIERKAMNPADETTAFKSLVDTGLHDASTIAKRFGFTETFVKRRLKMAVLAPEILNALRIGAITLDSAEAYAATNDTELQLRIFKAESRPNAYAAHSKGNVLRAIAGAGIRADGPIGIFIGGAKAYQKAGGEVAIDTDFGDLFDSVMSDAAKKEVRLSNGAIVDTLFNTACASAEKKMLKAARELFPFVTGIEWVKIGQYGPELPKPGKGYTLAEVYEGWDKSRILSKADLKKRAAKAVEKEGAACCAIISIDEKGQPYVRDNVLVIGKEAWDKTAPKPKKGEEPAKHPSDMTPEERAAYEAERKAAERARAIAERAALLWARKQIGPTPGFGITDVTIDSKGHLILRMAALDEESRYVSYKDVTDEGAYASWNRELKAEVLEPFLEEAEAHVAAAEKEAEIQQREQEAKRKEAAEREAKAIAAFNDVYNKMLDETVPPEVLILTDAQEDATEFEIAFINLGEGWVHTDDEGDEETIEDFSVVADLISSYVDERTIEPVLTTFATYGDYEAHLAQKGDVDQSDAEQLQADDLEPVE